MRHDADVRRLIEEALDSGRPAELVCAARPDLLAEVEEGLRRTRAMQAELDAIFPALPSDPPSFTQASLPDIPGYEVHGVLGHGGMGVVFAARHRRLNRQVAIKMLLGGGYAAPAAVGRFLREAEAVARLQHPNIVQVYDVGESEGRPYFTMELVAGGNLAQQLGGRPRSARDAATLLATLARAVQAAHDAGIVHRDLKPANILMTRDGTPKISDFGLARPTGGDPSFTLTGARLGTPSYMAPEQALGRPRDITPAVDVHALGAMLFELLTGRPPFRAETAAETERLVISQEPVSPTQLNARVPRDLATICLKALRKEPSQRYASARAMAEDLERFLRGETIAARPVGAGERAWRWARRRPAEAALVGALVVLVAVGAAVLAREWALAERQAAEIDKWVDRLAFVHRIQSEGRFDEARAILGRLPDAGSSALRARIRQAQEDLDVVEQLEEIRLTRGRFAQGGGFDYDAASARYERAFRELRLGERAEDPAVVAERLARSNVRRALVSALDDWAACAAAEPRAWILAVARGADPDPWRDAVRDQERWARLDVLTQLGASADVARQPVALMVAMGTRWRRLGGDPTDFLLRVQRHHPSDFWVNFELGLLLGARDRAAAVGFLRAALAARPDAGAAHYNLGVYLAMSGDADGAVDHFERSAAAQPDYAAAHHLLGLVHGRAGRSDAALASLRTAVALEPRDADLLRALNAELVSQGLGAEAAQRWRAFLETAPADHAAWDGYAELCLFLGDEPEYRRARTELLRRFGASEDPHECERTGRACLLAPGSELERRAATALVERALSSDPAHAATWARPYFLFAQALAEFRDERPADSLATLERCGPGVLPPAAQALTALALAQLGDDVGARRALAACATGFDWRDSQASTREAWIYHALRREAEARVLGDVDALLAGDAPPRDRHERLAWVGACEGRALSARLAALYVDAFAEEPELAEDLAAGHRFRAARHAARAGCGRSAEAASLDAAARRVLRERALGWLRADLVRWTAVEATGAPTYDPREVAEFLRGWIVEPDLAGVRDAEALAALPTAESEAWSAFWSAVDAARRRPDTATSAR